MTVHELMVHPNHCFCEVPQEELEFWANKHYRDHVPTMELLHSTTNPHDKEVISLIAILDMDDDTMLRLMDHVEMPEYHILDCRHQIQHILKLEKAS